MKLHLVVAALVALALFASQTDAQARGGGFSGGGGFGGHAGGFGGRGSFTVVMGTVAMGMGTVADTTVADTTVADTTVAGTTAVATITAPVGDFMRIHGGHGGGVGATTTLPDLITATTATAADTMARPTHRARAAATLPSSTRPERFRRPSHGAGFITAASTG
jgi:hypothetical protein